MNIDLSLLQFSFSKKPLLVGGMAMEYYGLRKAGKDIDLIVPDTDYQNLAHQYPTNKKDLYGDLGVCIHGFEIWKTICLYPYDFLSHDATEETNILIISLEMLLFMKTLGKHIPKYERDADLIVKKIFSLKYPNFRGDIDLVKK